MYFGILNANFWISFSFGLSTLPWIWLLLSEEYPLKLKCGIITDLWKNLTVVFNNILSRGIFQLSVITCILSFISILIISLSSEKSNPLSCESMFDVWLWNKETISKQDVCVQSVKDDYDLWRDLDKNVLIKLMSLVRPRGSIPISNR